MDLDKKYLDPEEVVVFTEKCNSLLESGQLDMLIKYLTLFRPKFESKLDYNDFLIKLSEQSEAIKGRPKAASVNNEEHTSRVQRLSLLPVRLRRLRHNFPAN